MTLTLRSASTTTATTKGAVLTHAEMDANWLHLARAFSTGWTIVDGSAVKMSLAAHQDTNYVTGDASAGGCLDIYSQLTSSLHDLVLLAQGAGDIHVGSVEGGTGAFFVDMNIKVASWNNGTRGNGLQVLQEDNSVVMEFPYSGGIIEVPGVLRGGNGANKDLYIRMGGASGTVRIVNAANNATLLTINNSGVVTIPSLAGTGSRTVVADANGVLSAP